MVTERRPGAALILIGVAAALIAAPLMQVAWNPPPATETATGPVEFAQPGNEPTAAATTAPPRIASGGLTVGGQTSSQFTENAGQLERNDIRYTGTFQGFHVGFAPSSILITVEQAVPPAETTSGLLGVPPPAAPSRAALVELTFPGSESVMPEARAQSLHFSNFIYGSDPARWVTGARSYSQIAYPSLWPGVDLVYHATPQGAKYEFVVAPGADPSMIRVAYAGVDDIQLASDGQLIVRTAGGTLTDSAPLSWQSSGAPVECRFALQDSSSVGFACDGRDNAATLTIDPLVSSTYLGGSDYDQANGVAADESGNTFVAGQVYSTNFPITAGSYDTTKNSGYDAFVSKVSSDGSALLYSTYIGGASDEYAYALAVDAFGNAYITGYTYSTNYPTTIGAYSRTNKGGGDAFLTKLNSTGAALDFSTMLGGTSYEYGTAVAVDANGLAAITGYTYSTNSSFPLTTDAFDKTPQALEVFVTKFNFGGTGLVGSTYVGGSSDEYGWGIAVDGQGNSYVTGYTYSYNFPTTPGAQSRTQSGNWDVFAVKLNGNLSNLTYGTFIGGNNYEQGTGIAVDAAGAAFVTGSTYSNNFPTTPGSYEPQYVGSYDAFVLELDNYGAIVNSTFIGGAQDDQANSIAIDSVGQVLVAGQTVSTDFPVAGPPLNGTLVGSWDAFALKLNHSLSTLIYSTYLGGTYDDYANGIAADINGTAHIVGHTYSMTDFPVSANAFQDSNDGYYDAFVTKIDMRLPRISITTDPPGLLISVEGVTLTAPHNRTCATSVLVYAASPQVHGQTRYVFDGWSDGGAQLHALDCFQDYNLVARFTTQFAFTVNSTPPGMYVSIDDYNLTAPQSYWWTMNTNHTIVAISPQLVGATRYAFVNWSDGGAANHSFVATGPMNFSAAFTPIEHRATLTTVPPKRQLIVDGEPALSPLTFWWPVGSAHTIEAPSPQVGASGVRYVFASWSDAGAFNHSVTAAAPLALTATFTDEFLTILETEPSNLSLLIDGLPVVTPVSYWWVNGSSHTLATPPVSESGGNTRYSFDRWNDVAPQNRTLRADGPTTLRATFAPSAFLVSLDTTPAGLDLEVDGARVTAPVSYWWDARSDHLIAAVTPQEKLGGRFFFIQWSDRLQRSHTVTAYSPFTVMATFNAEFLATLESDPSGFSVSVDGTTVTTPWTGWWRSGTDHRFTLITPQKVTSDTRYNYDSWSDGGTQDHTVNITAPSTFTVRFKAEYRVTASSQYGLAACDVSTCWYPAGATASVSVSSPRAGPPGVQYAFARWQGDSTAENVVATFVVDGPKVVSAQWKIQYFLSVTSNYGTVSESSWYDEGATASVSIAPTELELDGVQYKFVGWTGALTSSAPSESIVMNGAKNIAAHWEAVEGPPPETTQPTTNTGGTTTELPVAGIALGGAAAAAGLIGLLVMMRRRRGDDDDDVEISAAAPPAAANEQHIVVTAAPAAAVAPVMRPVRVPKPPAPVVPPPAPVAPAPPPAAQPAAAETDPCPECGEPLEFGWIACPGCGLELEWG